MNDLEKRVAILEQEIAVLKNQIKTALLDIQEHLLNNTHESLRSGYDNQAVEEYGYPIQKITIDEDDDDEDYLNQKMSNYG